MFKPVQIADNVYWVGYRDWNIRNFHGYKTERGSSYNAYLIIDEKITLIDTVKAPYAGKLLENIAQIIDPAKIDYLISNHTEPDHSGSIPAVLAAAPNATLVAVKKGLEGLEKYYGGGWRSIEVKTGDTLDIGRLKLEFIATPMIHWPDSMMTYVHGLELLFSMDAFGQHYATSELFDDEVSYCELMQEAKTYYANIIMHLGSLTKKAIPAVEALPISLVAPSHGVIWRKHFAKIVAEYKKWVDCKPTAKIVIIYDSMWSSTETMAQAIGAAATRDGVCVKLLRIPDNELTNLITEVLDAAVVLVGTPTLNNGMMPTVSAFLTYMTGLKPTGKQFAAFGSHGWRGGGATSVDKVLRDAALDVVCEPLTCVFKPDGDTLAKCAEWGESFAGAALAAVAGQQI